MDVFRNQIWVWKYWLIDKHTVKDLYERLGVTFSPGNDKLRRFNYTLINRRENPGFM